MNIKRIVRKLTSIGSLFGSIILAACGGGGGGEVPRPTQSVALFPA